MASLLEFLNIGIKEATENNKKVPITPTGASLNWVRTLSPVESSAPKAATKATMARRPLMISGAGPEKAINSPNPGVFGAGGGGGGVAACNKNINEWSVSTHTTSIRGSHGHHTICIRTCPCGISGVDSETFGVSGDGSWEARTTKAALRACLLRPPLEALWTVVLRLNVF